MAALYWEWNEGRNYSALPSVLGRPAAELNELCVTAAGTIVSPVERDGDRVDFTMKLSRIVPDTGTGQSADTLAAGEQGAELTGSQAGGPEVEQAEGELIAVQIKLQAEPEIAVAGGWQRGDQVQLDGELGLPAAARNYGGFDYRAYLHTQGIHWLLKGSGAESVKAASPAEWHPAAILRWSDAARRALGAELDHLFQEPDAGYMKGLVIGIQNELDPETFRQFSQLGLTHILAISGMHVAVYVGVLLFVFRRCRLTRETALTLTVLLVPVYVLLSGAGPSVVRAGLMGMIALLAARFGLLKDGLNILAASALIMLVWNPYLLLSVSFQLSFLVTAGLMIYIPLFTPLLKGVPRWLGSAVSVTTIAQLVSFPLTIYYFNQISLLSIAANLVLVPFITFLILPLGTLALLLGQIWEAGAGMVAHFTGLLNHLTFAAVEWMNGFAAGVLIWKTPSLLWICTYYLLLYGLLYAASRRSIAREIPQLMEDETKPLAELVPPEDGRGWKRRFGIRRNREERNDSRQPVVWQAVPRWCRPAVLLCAAGLILLLYSGYHTGNPSGGAGRISYLDVGQGDSILITTPEGGHILVDGGGTVSFGTREAWRTRRSPFEVGAKTLLPLLKQRGIHRLDAIILTHGDQDHAGGLQAVLEGMPVSALLFNGTLAGTEPYAKLMKTALAAGVRLYPVEQGMTLAPGKQTRLSFLWPQPQKSLAQAVVPEVEDQNHESVVFRLEMNGRNFLFTGDMDKAAEAAILSGAEQSGTSEGPPIDVLKVAHHGSKTATSADWLAFWHPAAAVISAGVNNLYGHPNGEVLDRLTAADAVVFRTDQQGEIQMEIRKDGITVRHKLASMTDE
jgi:competence protein ComEC